MAVTRVTANSVDIRSDGPGDRFLPNSDVAQSKQTQGTNQEHPSQKARRVGEPQSRWGGTRACYKDSTEIRAALHKRLEDTYEEARREAIWGLARRRDPLGLKLLLEHLKSESWWSGDESAAEETLGVEMDTPVEELCRGLQLLLTEASK